jgi:hypothetical protein
MRPRHGEQRQRHNPWQLKCTVLGCSRWFKNVSGRTKHIRSHHGARVAMHPHLQRQCQPSPPTMHADDTTQMGRVGPSSPQPSHSPSPLPGGLPFSPLFDMGALSDVPPAQSLGDRDYPEEDLQIPPLRNSAMSQQFWGSPPHTRASPQFSHRSCSHMSNQPSEPTSNHFLANISHLLINGECVLPMHIQAYLKPC